MKKLLFTIALTVCATTVGAQKWVTTNHNSEGVPDYTSYLFHIPDVGSVTFLEGDVSLMLLYTQTGTFAYQPCTAIGIGKEGNFVTVELYDQKENLVETIDIWCWKCKELENALETRSNKTKVRRILNHLKSGRGKIRLFAQRERHYPKDFYEYLPPMY